MGGIMLILFMFLALAWYSFIPIFPEEVTEQLHVGMSPREVVAVLGAPKTKWELERGRTTWRYACLLRADFLVRFDNERMVACFHDHD